MAVAGKGAAGTTEAFADFFGKEEGSIILPKSGIPEFFADDLANLIQELDGRYVGRFLHGLQQGFPKRADFTRFSNSYP